MAQLVKCLYCKHKDPGSIPRILTKPSVHQEGRERQAWGSLDQPNSHCQKASLALIGGQASLILIGRQASLAHSSGLQSGRSYPQE